MSKRFKVEVMETITTQAVYTVEAKDGLEARAKAKATDWCVRAETAPPEKSVEITGWGAVPEEMASEQVDVRGERAERAERLASIRTRIEVSEDIHELRGIAKALLGAVEGHG